MSAKAVPMVYAIATMDTKGPELTFLVERLRALRVSVVTLDFSTKGLPAIPADVDRSTIAGFHPTDMGRTAALGDFDRGPAITAMSEALVCYLRQEHNQGKVAGVLGIGGSGGTALITPAMRGLPVGLPKLMISTVASGNTAHFVGCSDIAIMPSVVDVAGINAVSRRVLCNAAGAMAGMVQNQMTIVDEKPTIAMTMFGVTTPCVSAVRADLESRGFDCLVFHATGIGGQAMEELVQAGLIQGVLDITTTEVADRVVGGILPCGHNRFEAIIAAKIPFVLSLGALDMVNFGAVETVPEKFRDRRLHVHNAFVTLMRTTADENRRCARWIAEKLNQASSPWRILIPENGISALDAPGQAFHDPDADAALFDELESAVVTGAGRSIRRLPLHINDPEFAQALIEEFRSLYPAFTEVPA
jgi:uncharacterized protein (UPF0261 family)